VTGFNMVMPGNTAEAVVSPVVKSVVEKSLPNKKADFFEQFKKVQEAQVKGLSFTGKYGSVNENSKIITSSLGTETSNNVNESNKILSEQLCEGNTPETITGNSGESTLLGAGIKVVSMQNEAIVLANSTKQIGKFVSLPDISQDESQQHPAWVEQSNYPEQVTPEEDSGQAVVAKMSNTVIDGIVLDSDSSKQVALSGNNIQLLEAELATHPQVFKPVEPIPGLQPELDKQLKSAAGHENQLGTQVTGEPGTDQPEPTNNTHNQYAGKGVDAGQLKLDLPVVQTSNQDSLVLVEGSEEVVPTWTNPVGVLNALEPIPNVQLEPDKQLKGVAGHENPSGAQVTVRPGTDQPEPTNNIHNQYDGKGIDTGQLKLDPSIVQTSSNDILVTTEGNEEVAPIWANPEPTLEELKPLKPIPDMQSEPGKQLEDVTGHAKPSGIQVTVEPGTAHPEQTNNVHNQQDSKGSDTGGLKLDPPVVQTSTQDILVPVEGNEEVAPIRTNPEPTLEVLKPLESIPDSQSESGRQLKGVAGNENQSVDQITGKPGTDQPEPTNNVHNQHDSKGVDVGRLKVDPPVMQTSGQDSLVLVEDGEEVVPTRTTPKVTLEKLKPLEPIPIRQPEQSKELKGVADNDNQSGAKVTVKPGTDQAEPINNIHNQYDSKGVDAGRLKVDPPVMQTSGQDSLVLAEDGKEVFPTQTTTEVTLEMLKPLETIPDMQSEQGKELKGTGHENQSGFKPAGKGMEMQISMVDDSRDSSQQPVASTIAATGEPELAKGRVPTVVDKQVEMDVRATPDRPLVQVSRVNHSSNTTQPGFEPTANDEAGEKAYSTRKEFPSVDVRKLIEFESHRFRGTKLNTFEGRENLFKEGGDENRPNLNILNRTDLEWLRSGIRNTGMDTGGRFSTNTREIIDQVVKNAELLLRANVSELKIELKPEFLGRLTIKVALEDGAVIARLIAENQQVKHMLESNLTSLKQSLESQGIKVERAEVSVQLNNGGMFDGSEDSRQYLWHEQQHSQQQSHQYWGDGIYSNEALEIMEHEGIVEGPDYGINENGNLNFLI
jgi:hypothetical protein